MKHSATVEVKPVSKGKTNSEPEVCAEQPPRYVVGTEESIATAHVVVTDSQLGEHPPHDPVEIPPRGDVGHKRGVLFLHGRPVGTVHVGIVEEISIDPPRLIENLRPLGAWIDTDLDVAGGQASLARVDGSRRGDQPVVT